MTIAFYILSHHSSTNKYCEVSLSKRPIFWVQARKCKHKLLRSCVPGKGKSPVPIPDQIKKFTAHLHVREQHPQTLCTLVTVIFIWLSCTYGCVSITTKKYVYLPKSASFNSPLSLISKFWGLRSLKKQQTNKQTTTTTTTTTTKHRKHKSYNSQSIHTFQPVKTSIIINVVIIFTVWPKAHFL